MWFSRLFSVLPSTLAAGRARTLMRPHVPTQPLRELTNEMAAAKEAEERDKIEKEQMEVSSGCQACGSTRAPEPRRRPPLASGGPRRLAK